MIGLIYAEEKLDSLFPYNKVWEPSCLPVCNVPLIRRNIEILKKLGINKFKVFCKGNINEISNVLYPEKFDVFSSYEEMSLLSEDVLLINANMYVCYEDVEKVYKTYIDTNRSVVLAKEKSRFDLSINDFGIATNNQFVKKIYGHVRDHYIDFMLVPVYVLKKEFFQHIKSTPNGMNSVVSGIMPPMNFYLENVIQIFLDRGNDVSFELSENSAFMVKLPSDLLEANILEANRLTNQITNSSLNYETDGTCHIKGNLLVGKNVRINRGVIIKGNCIIGDNVEISDGAILEGNNIIGSNVFIKDYAKVIKSTVIGNYCKLGYNAEVGGVFLDGASQVHGSEMYGIVGKFVDVAAGCITGILRFDDGIATLNVKGKKYQSLYTNAAFIGDYTRLGINNLFYPGVRIGAYCALGPGAILEKDVDHNKILRLRQEIELNEWGSDRYGWK